MSARKANLPLKRLSADPLLWAKIAALWHRERVRGEYAASDHSTQLARKKANDEALEVARAHGFKGTLAELKKDLAELLVNDLPALRKRSSDGILYWEDVVQADMVRLLAGNPAHLRDGLKDYLREEVDLRGRFAGDVGLYRLIYVLGYVPAMEHLEQRNAFIAALGEIGHDSRMCDTEMYKVVMKYSRQYTLQPFETRLGFSMPKASGSRPAASGGLGWRLRRLIRPRPHP